TPLLLAVSAIIAHAAPTYYDGVEIGTSDFYTLSEGANPDDRILAIEPIKYYLDRLPIGPNRDKANVAISNYDGEIEMYYVPDDVIQKHNLPRWLRGCNSVGKPHPATADVIRQHGLPDS